MKKFIVLLIASNMFISCKKDSTANSCWKCELAGTFNGVNYNGQSRTVCGTSTEPSVTDASGNNIVKPGGCMLQP